MEIMRPLGKTGISVSALGFGGAEIGFNDLAIADVRRILESALDAGVSLVDTASAYLTSEEQIGEAISHRRKDFTLVTKCGAIEGFTKSDWSEEGILKTVQQSLKRLRTDYVDVLLLHSCGELEMRWGEALAGVAAAKERGYARCIGYSGDGGAALWALKSGEFDVLECSVNIADQEAIELLLPTAHENGVGVIAKRPLANAAWRYTDEPENDYHTEYWRRLRALEYPFLSSPEVADTALRFVLSQPAVSAAIVGTLNSERYVQNLASAKKGALDAPALAQIRKRWKEVADVTWVGQI